MLTQELSVWESSYDVATNTSVVSIVLTSTQDQYSYQGYTQTGTYWVAANGGGWDGGTNYTYTLQKSTTNTILSTTRTITHNADGTGSVKVQTSSPTTPSVGTVVKEVSINLTTIPRASTPTVSKASADMNTAVTINTNRASSSFTHTLTYKFGNATGTIATNVGASYNWTIPIAFANQVPSATSGTCTITCTTYSGSTNVGSKTVNLTCTVPSSVAPTISSVVPSDPTGFATTYSAYVQNKSKVKVTVSASGAYSSTIKSYSINNGVGGSSTSNPYESGVITAGAGAKTVSVTVTDTRGRTATKTATFTVVGYSVPAITSFGYSRCDANGNASDAGAYVKITYAGSVTNINSVNKNGHTFVVSYKKKSESSYTELVRTTDAYSVNTYKIAAADTESTYDIRFSVSDSYTTTTRDGSLSSAFVLMDFRSTGKGIGIGKVAETDSLEVGMPAKFTGGISENGTALSTKYVGTKFANQYYGMVVDGSDGAWLRTTSNGIIPYQSGGASAGHSYLGTSSWYFYEAYIQKIYGAYQGTIAWGNVTGKPSTYAPSSHTHSYLPLTGGTITGQVTYNVEAMKWKNGNLWCYTTGWRIAQDSYTSIVNTANNAYRPCYASSFSNPSSRLIKENIIDMTEEEALKILEVEPVGFDYKEKFGGEKGNFGLIAEDVLKVIPSCVFVPDGYDEKEFDEEKGIDQGIMTIDYAKLVPHLIKMVQMQQKEIDELKQLVNYIMEKEA